MLESICVTNIAFHDSIAFFSTFSSPNLSYFLTLSTLVFSHTGAKVEKHLSNFIELDTNFPSGDGYSPAFACVTAPAPFLFLLLFGVLSLLNSSYKSYFKLLKSICFSSLL